MERTGHTVYMVDDHPIVLQGMRSIINLQDDLEVVGTSDNADDAFSAINRLSPDVAIVDISLGESNGLDLVRRVSIDCDSVHCLVISMHDEFVYARRAIRAGARGYVMKAEAADSLVDAIRTVISGRFHMSPRLRSHLRESQPEPSLVEPLNIALDKLSDREIETFRLMGMGKSVRDIAAQMDVSPRTVATFRQRLKAKLGARTMNDLVRLAFLWAADQETLA